MMVIDPYRFGPPVEISCGSIDYGTAALGNATLTGTTTFTADRHYNNLTVQATVYLNGWTLYVDGTLDINHASCVITTHEPSSTSINGTTLVGELGSQGGDPPTPGGIGSVGNGGTGGAGGTGAPVGTDTEDGEPGFAGTIPVGANRFLGGRGGQGGAGGDSNQGSFGGIGGTSPDPTGEVAGSYELHNDGPWYGGTPAGGGGGGGDPGGFGAGGRGASGGCGGGLLRVRARTINRGASTPVGAIRAPGYVGNTGGSPSNTGGLNGGGGGGSGGGGGGVVDLAFAALTGASVTDCISADGAAGGNGATTGIGSGATAGVGGNGGDGGRIFVRNCSAGTFTETTGSAGSAASGSTGGSGGICRTNL